MQENGRQRAAKIDRFYHTGFDRWIYRKRWMGLLGMVVGILYSIWLICSNSGVLHVTTGELSQPHFAWNKSGCEQCHQANIPIRKDAWGGELVANIKSNNDKCNGDCHKVTGHFEAKTQPGILAKESCSDCHHEHLGFDRRLVEVPDRDCSRCHANIHSVAVQLESNIADAAKVAKNFSADNEHPLFASLNEPDPGTIRFSHAQHMRPGQPKSPNGADAKKLEMLPEKFRDQYKNNIDGESKLIQLTCSNCHERDVKLSGYESLESATANPDAAIQSSSHNLFKPVEFAKHCIACHDLDGVPHGLDRKQTQLAIQELNPRKTLEYLKTRFDASKLEDLGAGKLTPDMEAEIESRKKRIDALLIEGDKTCLKCHQPSTEAKSIVAASNIKQKWFRNAAFSHGAHLMVSCEDCHKDAYASSDAVFDWEQSGNKNSEEAAKKVMIPQIAKCRECHIQDAQERSQKLELSRGLKTKLPVATADCVDCHRYHSDPPPPKKSSTETSSISDFHRILLSETSP